MKEALFPGSPIPNPFRPDQILSEASWCLSSTSMEVESVGFFFLHTCSKQSEAYELEFFESVFIPEGIHSN